MSWDKAYEIIRIVMEDQPKPGNPDFSEMDNCARKILPILDQMREEGRESVRNKLMKNLLG